MTGEPRLRAVVLYADGQMRTLPPRFRDEMGMEAYIQRWNPDLVGKKMDFVQMADRSCRPKAHPPKFQWQ